MGSLRLGAIVAGWTCACLLAASSVGPSLGLIPAIFAGLAIAAAAFIVRQAAMLFGFALGDGTLVWTVLTAAASVVATVLVVLAAQTIGAISRRDGDEARRVAAIAVHVAGASTSCVLAIRNFVVNLTWPKVRRLRRLNFVF